MYYPYHIQVFSYMTFSLASLLIVLRTYVFRPFVPQTSSVGGAHSPGPGLYSIAVWQKNKLAIGLAIGVWLINASFLLEGKTLSSPLSDKLNV
jgi:hypothetical protein